MPAHNERAVVFVPATGNVAHHVDTCIEHCKRNGIEVVGVVPPGDWEAAQRMHGDGFHIVTMRRDHIPPDAAQIIVVAEHPADAKRRHRNQTPMQRRARRT